MSQSINQTIHHALWVSCGPLRSVVVFVGPSSCNNFASCQLPLEIILPYTFAFLESNGLICDYLSYRGKNVFSHFSIPKIFFLMFWYFCKILSLGISTNSILMDRLSVEVRCGPLWISSVPL